jgi:uncharacterized repeat protein (TIGR03803 family)
VLVGAFTASAQTYSVLYTFDTNPGDLYYPGAPGTIVQGHDGKLHIALVKGGTDNGGVMKLSTDGVAATIVDFTSLQAEAINGLTQATDGNFYGTSFSGGANGLGSIYKVSSTGVLSTLYSFTGLSDGQYPGGPLVRGSDGNLYGSADGSNPVLFKITTGGVFAVIGNLNSIGGGAPYGGLIQGSDGNLYGTTYDGNTGSCDLCGTIFKSTTSGSVTLLYNFTGSPDGDGPLFGLVQGSDGYLYGTTEYGGRGNIGGVVFKITTGGTYTILHTINGTTDGNFAASGLIQATDGNFYGVVDGAGTMTAAGTIYKISSAGVFTVVHDFVADGTNPATPLIQHTNGLLYGGTYSNSAGVGGYIYSLDIGAAAFAKLITTSGTVGSTLEILGQDFKKATTVSFAGVTTSTFTVNSSGTYMTVTVPTGAKTGTVTVTETSGSLASSQSFSVLPTISSFTPSSGPVGTIVTINGTGLTQTSKVTIGGVKATTFSVVSDSQLTVTVPTGAKTGKIKVTTTGGAVTSAKTFTVT